MMKRHCSSVELLPHDVVELILQRLPVKYLQRSKSVCKTWKSTIESRRFQQEQLICRRQSRGPEFLFLSTNNAGYQRKKVVLGSSIVCTVRLPSSKTMAMVCHGSCDGLVCRYGFFEPGIVVNPATKWHKRFPLSCIQQFIRDRYDKRDYEPILSARLGFGKDKFRGTYKLVWLYNSSEYGLDNVTTCEVFDFSTNAWSWRYILPASPYRILDYQMPVYLDGSLHWFTDCQDETKILSLDFHTETFQVISKAPFPAHVCHHYNTSMCVLDNRLCVSEKNWPTQVIWSFDSEGSKTWNKLCSIDLTKTYSWFVEPLFPLSPVALLEKNKLLLHGCDELDTLVIHDLHTKSYDLVVRLATPGKFVSYFGSLLSV